MELRIYLRLDLLAKLKNFSTNPTAQSKFQVLSS